MTSRMRCPEATYRATLAAAVGVSARSNWLSGWAAATAGAPVDTTKDEVLSTVAGGVSCDNSARVASSGVGSRFRLLGRACPVVLAFCEGADPPDENCTPSIGGKWQAHQRFRAPRDHAPVRQQPARTIGDCRARPTGSRAHQIASKRLASTSASSYIRRERRLPSPRPTTRWPARRASCDRTLQGSRAAPWRPEERGTVLGHPI